MSISQTHDPHDKVELTKVGKCSPSHVVEQVEYEKEWNDGDTSGGIPGGRKRSGESSHDYECSQNSHMTCKP